MALAAIMVDVFESGHAEGTGATADAAYKTKPHANKPCRHTGTTFNSSKSICAAIVTSNNDWHVAVGAHNSAICMMMASMMMVVMMIRLWR